MQKIKKFYREVNYVHLALSPNAGIILLIFIFKEVLWQLIYPNLCKRLIICENVYFAVDDVA